MGCGVVKLLSDILIGGRCILRLRSWQGVKCKEGLGVIDKIYNDFLNAGFTDNRQEWRIVRFRGVLSLRSVVRMKKLKGEYCGIDGVA